MDIQTEEHIKNQISRLEYLHLRQKIGLISEIAHPIMMEMGATQVHLYGMTPYFNDGDECKHDVKGWVGYSDGIAMCGRHGAPLEEYFSKYAKQYIPNPKEGYTHRKNGYALQYQRDVNGEETYEPPYEAISNEYGLPKVIKPFPYELFSMLDRFVSKLLGTNFILTMVKDPEEDDAVNVRYYPYTDHE